MTIANKRIPYWDNLKALLIFLVVLGHTGTAMGDKWLSVIYAFHMPLFVFVSGYFSRRKNSLWETIGKLVIIYLVFHLFYLVFDLLTGQTLSISRILTPSFSLWYILSLIFWRMIIYFAPQRVLDKTWLVLCATIGLSLFAGYVQLGTILSFQRTFVFLPFFIAGYNAHRVGLTVSGNRPLWHNVLALIILLGLSLLNYFKLPVFYANQPYLPGNGLCMRAIQLLIAIIISWSVLNLIPSRKCLLTEIGEISLLIFLLHPPIIKGLKVLMTKEGIAAGPVSALIITILTMSLIFLVRNLRILRVLR